MPDDDLLLYYGTSSYISTTAHHSESNFPPLQKQDCFLTPSGLLMTFLPINDDGEFEKYFLEIYPSELEKKNMVAIIRLYLTLFV